MPGPLHGFRIIDLTSVVSGPLAHHAAGRPGRRRDQGGTAAAATTRAWCPTGAAASPRRFSTTTATSAPCAWISSTTAGREVLMRLVAGADVLVQNFRPGVVERMGVGEDAVREVKPDIVYVSISGFGADGPYAGKPVYDPLVQALSGLATVQAGSDERAAAPGAHHHPRQAHRLHRGPGHHRRPAGPGAHRRGPARAPVHARSVIVLPLALGHGQPDLRRRRVPAGRGAELHRPDLRDHRRLTSASRCSPIASGTDLCHALGHPRVARRRALPHPGASPARTSTSAWP